MPKFRSLSTILLLLPILALFVLAGCGSEEKTSDADGAARDVATEEPMMSLDSVPSLQAELDARKVKFSEAAPADMVTAFEQGVREVAASGVLESARNVGDTAPMFVLPDAAGDSIALSDILADGPVVLMWYRGGWCPYCNLQLNAMQDILPFLDEENATLIAISPEIPDSALSTQETNELGFLVLSDVGNAVAREYGVMYELPKVVQEKFAGRMDLAAYNTAEHATELPLAVTYVINTDGTITYAFIDPDYRKRAEPSDIVREVRKLDWE